MREGILRFDWDWCFVFKLVRSQQAQNCVFKVCQNDVSGGIQLNQNVIGSFALSESKVNDTVNAQLFNFLKLLSAQMFSKLHTKTWRKLFLVLDVICSVDSYARLNKEVLFSVSSRKLNQIQAARYIINVCDPTKLLFEAVVTWARPVSCGVGALRLSHPRPSFFVSF